MHDGPCSMDRGGQGRRKLDVRNIEYTFHERENIAHVR